VTALKAGGRRKRAQKVVTTCNETDGLPGYSTGTCDDAMTDAVAHLLRASVAVDRLSRGGQEHRSDQAEFHLCQASLAIDRSLATLSEWSKAVRSPPSGLSASMRPDIERVLAQELRRALLDPKTPP
jgi:hypothetical protein